MKEIIAAVEKHRQLILDAERYIWKNPETGYKEYKTSAYMAENFRKLGYDLKMADGITGFTTLLDTGKPGPTILILGELDSIICPEHPESDPETGAVHSCGHNAQCAALLGIAAALKEPGILDKFCGKIMLCAVPAEELLEIEFRSKLRSEGKIRYLGGKSEFMSRGYFDGVDLAYMVHTSSEYGAVKGAVGCIAKQIVYKGVASHAGGSPWNGHNALYAATCGINAINAIRETFKESDIIRVHPIITNGGAMVNAIPEKTVLESYVRGSTFDGILAANKKVNQALCGAALSINTNVEIIDTPGYAPLINDKGLTKVFADAAKIAVPEYEFHEYPNHMNAGSTDMGDLCSVMPVIHPYAGGATGNSHGNNYQIADPVAACVGSAKIQLAVLKILLDDGAAVANEIVKNYKAPFASKEEYLTFMDSLSRNGDRITYTEDGIAKVDIN